MQRKNKEHIISRALKIVWVVLAMVFTQMGMSQVTSSVDTTQIRIGEEIQLRIEVEADTTSLVLFPEGKNFGALEVIESYQVDTSRIDAKNRLIKKYGLTQFDSGRYVLPSLRVNIDDRGFDTDSVLIEVKDVPVDTLKQKMFDIKPAIEVDGPPSNWVFWLLFILGLAAIGGLVWYLLRRKKQIEEKKKQLPPYEEAMEALQSLDGANYLETNKSKAYYSSLTEIVKRYLDREVDDRALESTSDELIERLQLLKDAGQLELSPEIIKDFHAILKRADLVKFAKLNLETGQARADRGVIENIINETKEAIPEPTEEELRANEEYLAELAKRKKKKLIVSIIAGVFGFIFGFALVYGFVNGFDTLKDKVFGNEMREISESRWYKSEYGVPAVIIETPEVLKRLSDSIPEGMEGIMKSMSVFAAGELEDPLFISVSTIQLPPSEEEIDLNIALDGSLNELEKRGAKNMIVKREEFQTEKGVKGLHAYGDFYVEVSEGRVLKEKSDYDLLIFAQQGGIQSVLIVYQNDENYAEDIKQRILDSVELEISNEGQKAAQ